ncbi:hypothetical protein [Pseudoalteromonas marina]|uniref:HU domain-containing protein n=1 Tax=Pseudoalteromonas marina TaxID=267375 RepID=A0ABT9FCJ9_9GAMM|nr:hypothetical protein [Pseudoalteromonas marina]MDP2564404.1 hypothetical protein [Pseudoalteromonas marina]
MDIVNKSFFQNLLIQELLSVQIEISNEFSKKCLVVLLDHVVDKVSNGFSFKVAGGHYLYGKAKSERPGRVISKNEAVVIEPRVHLNVVKTSKTQRVLLKESVLHLSSKLGVTDVFSRIVMRVFYQCFEMVLTGKSIIAFRGFGYVKPVRYKSKKCYIPSMKGFVDLPERNSVLFSASDVFRFKCESTEYFGLA